MRKLGSILGSTLFFFAAPGVMGGMIPWAITQWQSARPFQALQIAGAILVAAGLAAIIEAFARFALVGEGTPAPVAPTRRLVISGTYRYVRNPMYLAVAAIIFGQALTFGSIPVAVYGVLFLLTTHVFVVGYEEPTLLRGYGPQYDAYRTAVRRWLPRLKPWSPSP